jgi:hypothetical protein
MLIGHQINPTKSLNGRRSLSAVLMRSPCLSINSSWRTRFRDATSACRARAAPLSERRRSSRYALRDSARLISIAPNT